MQPALGSDNSFASTSCLGSLRRGGWRPIMLSLGHGPGIIIDWQCPSCNKPIYSQITGSFKCWRCSLVVLEYPDQKYEGDNRQRDHKHRDWKSWINSELEDNAKGGSAGSTATTRPRSVDDMRPGEPPSGKNRQRDTFSKHPRHK